MRRAAILLVSVLLTFLVGALSRVPYTAPGAGEARLRFAWRMNVAGRERCRDRTAEELAELPVHMRTPQECSRDAASYALLTRIDEEAADTLALVRGGAKGDRPLFVLEERTLPPGEHRIRVVLQRAAGEELQSLAALDTVLRLRAGHTQLITLNDDASALVAVSGAR